jgi:CheY-like chemotaxis protein
MFNKSAIVIIEDDPDDQHLIGEALQALHLPNPLHFFDRGDKALAFLHDYQGAPFLILCDMNMPGMNGLELLEKMYKDNRLQNKKAPFIFFSTSATPVAIRKAYSFFAQGFFVKPHAIAETKRLLQMIINYWQVCQHPAVTV